VSVYPFCTLEGCKGQRASPRARSFLIEALARFDHGT
jgi:hypothetical protein